MAINYGNSGNDPRGQSQNNAAYQQSRYNDQQGPMVNAFAYNYGRGSEADYGNYTDIMNQYRNIATGSGGSGGSSGGGGGGGGGTPAYTAFQVHPGKVTPGKASYSDPFASYKGFQEFSNTGGYSADDIANMRARGVAPIRAAYANAEQNLQRGRSLQGGYSPNMAAAQVQMAREQGQSAADATQNVEAGLAQARNTGRLAGLTGMSGIEGQRLGADVDISKFNTGLDFQGQTFNTNLDFQGQTYNADAQARAQAQNNAAAQASASRAAASAAASNADKLRALAGMSNLYGTTPGMSQTFGNQLLQGVGQGGTFGLNMMGRQNEGQQLPGQYDQTMGRAKDIIDTGARMGQPIYDWYQGQQQKKQQQGNNGGYGNAQYQYDSDDPNSVWYEDRDWSGY